MHTSRDAIQSMEQLCKAWAPIVADRGTGETTDLPGMAVRWAESEFMFWNAVTLTEANVDVGGARRRLASVASYMRSKRKPGLLWLFEDLLAPSAQAGLADLVQEAGFKLMLSGYGMAGDILAVAEPDDLGLTFVCVKSEDELKAYADVNAQAYGMAKEAVRDGLTGSTLWTTEMHAFLGLKDGIPVTAAATIKVDGCLFVALVATVPEYQRQGYADAIVRKALYEGAKGAGLRRATLHATMAGCPVYERIGFKKVSTIRFYGLSD